MEGCDGNFGREGFGVRDKDAKVGYIADWTPFETLGSYLALLC